MEQPSAGQDVGESTPHTHADGVPHTHADSIGSASSTGSTPAPQQRTWDDTMGQLDMYAERARVALPVAPPGLMNFYMSFVPWVSIIFGVLFALISLVALVGSTILGPLMIVLGSPGTGFGLFAGSVIALVGSVLDVIGGWLMLQRKATGWWIFALGLVIGLLSNLVRGSILSLIIVLLIAYVHLQVKPNYR